MHELEENPEAFKVLLRAISGFSSIDPEVCVVPGVRVLGQRHHSETLKLEVM